MSPQSAQVSEKRNELNDLLSNFIVIFRLDGAALLTRSGLLITWVSSDPTTHHSGKEYEVSKFAALFEDAIDRVKRDLGAEREFYSRTIIGNHHYLVASADPDTVLVAFSLNEYNERNLRDYTSKLSKKIEDLLSGDDYL